MDGERRDLEAQGDDSSSTQGQELARGHLLCCGLCFAAWGEEGVMEQSPAELEWAASRQAECCFCHCVL